jgi:hypothetical protein
MGNMPSLADPCLFYKNGKTKSFIIIYVDDGGIVSDEITIQDVISALSKRVLRKNRELHWMQTH